METALPGRNSSEDDMAGRDHVLPPIPYSSQGSTGPEEREQPGHPCFPLTCSLVGHQLAHFTLHCSECVPWGLLRKETRTPQIRESQQVLGTVALKAEQSASY